MFGQAFLYLGNKRKVAELLSLKKIGLNGLGHDHRMYNRDKDNR